MKQMISATLAAAVMGFCSAAGATSSSGAMDHTVKAKQAVAGWPDASKQAAEALIEKYGSPDSVEADRLQWDRRGQFKRIVVSAATEKAPAVVENTIRYDVPRNGIGLLALKGGYVLPNGGEKELSAFGGSEQDNLLALNAANDVMTGAKDAAQARDFYAQTSNLRASGKSSESTESLQFKVKDPMGLQYSSELGGYIETN